MSTTTNPPPAALGDPTFALNFPRAGCSDEQLADLRKHYGADLVAIAKDQDGTEFVYIRIPLPGPEAALLGYIIASSRPENQQLAALSEALVKFHIRSRAADNAGNVLPFNLDLANSTTTRERAKDQDGRIVRMPPGSAVD